MNLSQGLRVEQDDEVPVVEYLGGLAAKDLF